MILITAFGRMPKQFGSLFRVAATPPPATCIAIGAKLAGYAKDNLRP